MSQDRDLEHDAHQLPRVEGGGSTTTVGRSSTTSGLAARGNREPSGILMRKAAGEPAADAERAVDTASASSGEALPGDLRARFEGSLGTDLSSVRVHTGAESQQATQAVGAHAYATGNDIHFAAGQYDPSSAGGQELIAHEVAHTVQQRGGSPQRQHKLAVSSAGDSLEVEADQAARAMVSGAPTTVSGGGLAIARKADDAKPPEAGKPDDDKAAADVAWAEETRAKIHAVQAALATAQTRLQGDARAAIAGLRKASTSYTAFDKKYARALERFMAGVAAAAAAAKELQDGVKNVANIALSAAAPILTAAVGEITGVLEKADQIARLAGAIGVGPPPPAAAGGSNTNVGGPTQTDWGALVATTIGTFETFVGQSAALGGTAELLTASDQYLDSVVSKRAGDNPQTTAEGTKAAQIATNEGAMITTLATIGDGSMSRSAIAFGNQASSSLDSLSDRKIEQDIAVRWMGTLKTTVNGFKVEDQTQEIDDAREYLRKLGVEDRLGHDAGMYMTEHDQRLLAARAKIESEVMALVGTGADWLGGSYNSAMGGYFGRVRAGGREWSASGKELSEQAGGYVTIQSYRIDEIPSDHPSTKAGEEVLRGLTHVTVAAQGPMGGGEVSGPQVESKPA